MKTKEVLKVTSVTVAALCLAACRHQQDKPVVRQHAQMHAIAHAAELPDVLTRSGNNLRTGVYQDSALTPDAVSQRGLRKYFSLPTEGDARSSESQPLIRHGVVVQDGHPRNLLVVSTLNNLVWAYDAVTSDIVWVQKLGIPIKSDRSIDFWGTQDHFGVLSTGVIDRATNIWYGVAWVSPDQTPRNGKHFFYGLNLKDGSFAFAPVQFPAEYESGVLRKQRVSLGLATFGGHPVVLGGSGTMLETGATSAGFLFAFDTLTHKITLKATAQNGGGAGIWQSGSGLVIDEAKQAIFGITGNGTFDPSKGDYAESAFRATYTPNNGFAIVDWFTPWTDKWRAGNSTSMVAMDRLAGHSLSTADQVDGQPVNGMHGHAMPKGAAMGDEDWGSGPCNYIPQYGEELCSGKDSIGILINAWDMGKTQPADLNTADGVAANYRKLYTLPFWYGAYAGAGVNAWVKFAGHAVTPQNQQVPSNAQQLNNQVWFDGKTHHVHSASVVDGDYLYVGAENSNVRAWKANPDHTITYLANSDDVASPDLANKGAGGMTGWFCAGSTAGILACLRPHGDANRSVTQGDLFIFDSKNFGTRPDGSRYLKILWRSDQPGHNVQPITFDFNKFCPPVIWDGNVYVPTYNPNTGILVLGLN